jgi:RNA polymerase sigma-B factor
LITADFGHNDSFVTRYHYLCRRGARKFLRAGLERSDLEQVAAIGLIKAGRRYERSSNTPFEAYAWILIVGELMHYVRDYEHLMRVPRGIRRLERHCWETFERLAAQLGREPSDDEIAKELGTPPALVRSAKLSRWVTNPTSLEQATFREQAIQDRLERTAELIVTDSIVLDEALAVLAPAERYIVVSHYVFSQTQNEIAAQLGLSTRQVSRLQQRALARMRAHVEGAA